MYSVHTTVYLTYVTYKVDQFTVTQQFIRVTLGSKKMSTEVYMRILLMTSECQSRLYTTGLGINSSASERQVGVRLNGDRGLHENLDPTSKRI